MKTIKKYWKLIIVTAIILLSGTGIFAYFVLTPFSEISNLAKNSYEENDWNLITKNGYEVVVCSNDLLNPKSVVITKKVASPNTDGSGSYFGYNYYTLYYGQLHRPSIFDKFTYEHENKGSSTVYWLDFAKKDKSDPEKDLFYFNLINDLRFKGCNYFQKSEKIDDYDINYTPPLTPQEIENNRKLREETEAFDKKQKEDLEKRKTTPKEVTYKNCVDGTNLLYSKYEEAKKQGLTELDGINLNTITLEELKQELDSALELCKTVLK